MTCTLLAVAIAAMQVAAPSRLASSLLGLLDSSPPAVAGAKQWASVAADLQDAASALAEEPALYGDSVSGEHPRLHMSTVDLIGSVLDTAKSASPDLYAVAKLSAKRNGKLSSSRAASRCLVELGLLLGTYSALEPGAERSALLERRVGA